MLEVTGIKKGIVIDHIAAGKGLKIFEKLSLHEISSTVVLLMNVPSKTIGAKDIIKVQDHIDLDLNILGLIDENITVNVIDKGIVIDKKQVEIPHTVKGLFKCKNPRCITWVDDYAESEFTLVPNGKIQYQCHYCEELTEYKL
ncbi:MAG: aspartate carbamoyltransferase regulatory subunit [Clostridiaceae bacterium]|nr:aspartate carbamoyltransferase regulatory subunit [Clostridiaceae bacterium]